MKITSALCLLAASLCAPASAVLVPVTVVGEVEFNQIADPPLGNVGVGESVSLTFVLDSESFVNSGSFPTRGYDIDPATFLLAFDSATIGLQDPFPAGQTPYFVIRDNDPAVDGFFVSTDIDFPVAVPLDQTGVFGQFENNYSVTYTGDTLASLDLLEARGLYDFTGLTVFNWTVDDGPFQPLGMVFESMLVGEALIFSDGFESGDVSAWSSSVP